MESEDEYPTADQIKELIEYSSANNRVCPLPYLWNELWKMIPERKETVNGWEPPAPLILGAWYNTPASLKILSLTDQIEYAAEHGGFKQVDDFLRGLKEEEWAHLGDV
jgi:hypothetical protein